MEIRGLPIDNYHRPIARYEIRFSVETRFGQGFCGLPPDTVYFGRGDVFTCMIILPAYTAEDALTDLRARLGSLGWYDQNIRIEWILPTDAARPELEAKI